MGTYVHQIAHSGAETVADQLNGTPVAQVGISGRVWAAFYQSKAETTGTLRGRTSGIEIIPAGSHPNHVGAADLNVLGIDSMVFYGENLIPGEDLELEIITAAASETMLMVKT